MSKKKLTARFFARPTLTVARDLLGKYLVVKRGRKTIAGKIVETEAYIGEKDLACHASKGRTPRSEILYHGPGTIYVYMIYGMYYCLNFVTERKDFPSAVLIRAVEKEGAGGPGKLCKLFGIDRRMNGKTVSHGLLWVEDRVVKVNQKDIARAKRIGVDYAGRYAKKHWRFYIRNNSFVSKK